MTPGHWGGRLGAALVGAAALAVILALVLPGSAAQPQPAGANPSAISKVVCEPTARNLIADALGTKATVSKPTWHHDVFSCDYRYGQATMVLSVKELSSWPQTYTYFDGLARSLHREATVFGLGQAAFRTADGSFVVRKDWKVLLVNVGGLPARFGNPPTNREGVALSVAGVIMNCWHGD